MRPTIGRIVMYRLTDSDAQDINRRRKGLDVGHPSWPRAAQAHVGNLVLIGQTFPMIVTAVFDNEYGEGKPGVNGQVFLDGNDSHWVTSVPEDAGPEDAGWELGRWSWPERAS